MAAFMDAGPKSRASVNDEKRNAELLQRLLAKSGSILRSQARRNAPSGADAEDALQDACILFISRYEGSTSLLDALRWMQLVVKRCAWTIWHRDRREVMCFEDGFPAYETGEADSLHMERRGPQELAELTAELEEKRELIDQLKTDERRALLLVGLGYSYKEICEHYGWTKTKINRCLSEGRAALRKKLAEGE